MRRSLRSVALMLAAGMLLGGCYGPFYLVRKVHKFNGEVSDNKWVVEVVYLVCSWLPVYGLAAAADAIIFNSIEFWTGNNPLAETADAQGVRATKRIVRGETETVLQRVATPEGDQLFVAQYVKGEPVNRLRIQQQDGGTIAYNGDGAMLFSARTLPDGRVVITDATGAQVASYSGEQARKFLASVPR